MNDLKRYDLDGEDAWTRESEKGDYVLAEDHEVAIAKKDARISELEGVNADLLFKLMELKNLAAVKLCYER